MNADKQETPPSQENFVVRLAYAVPKVIQAVPNTLGLVTLVSFGWVILLWLLTLRSACAQVVDAITPILIAQLLLSLAYFGLTIIMRLDLGQWFTQGKLSQDDECEPLIEILNQLRSDRSIRTPADVATVLDRVAKHSQGRSPETRKKLRQLVKAWGQHSRRQGVRPGPRPRRRSTRKK